MVSLKSNQQRFGQTPKPVYNDDRKQSAITLATMQHIKISELNVQSFITIASVLKNDCITDVVAAMFALGALILCKQKLQFVNVPVFRTVTCTEYNL